MTRPLLADPDVSLDAFRCTASTPAHAVGAGLGRVFC